MADIAAVVLAAGRSRRFGAANKLLADVGGHALVTRVVVAALASRARPVIVVTGHQQRRVARAVRSVRRPLRVVFNPAFADGLASSLKAGVACVPAGCAGAVVCLGDMPGIAPVDIDRLLAAFDGDADAVVPVHDGQRGNPVLLSRRLFAALAELDGDTGARMLLRGQAVREIRSRAAVRVDVDRRRDLRALRGLPARGLHWAR